MTHFEVKYRIDKFDVKDDTFHKLLVYLRNENVNYSTTSSINADDRTITQTIWLDYDIIFKYIETLSDYNDRLEHRLNKL